MHKVFYIFRHGQTDYNATRRAQSFLDIPLNQQGIDQAKELAKISDLMIVIGSKKSANTTHLAEILKDLTKTIHIESESELDDYLSLINNSFILFATNFLVVWFL